MEVPEKRILIVEDEPELREIIMSVLKMDYSSIDEAEDGFVAFEMLRKNSYALVLSDINMPKMTGIELFAEAKASDLSMPFVFLTAYGDQDNIMKALRLGAFDFIKKPFDENEVLEVVNRGIEVGYRRIKIEENLKLKAPDSSENIKKAHKMISLLELKNYKRRA